MTLNKEILTKIIRQSRKVLKEWKKLVEVLEPVGWNQLTPSSFYYQTDLIPEIKMIMGGDLVVYKSPFNSEKYEAQLTIDGIQFRNYFITEDERKRYGE